MALRGGLTLACVSAACERSAASVSPAHLRALLLSGRYRPGRLSRRERRKASGGVRVLHIPGSVDRAAQRAVLAVMAPAAEAIFLNGSQGFRKGRGVASALRHLERTRPKRAHVLLKVDLKSLFDTLQPPLVLGSAAQLVDPLWLTLVGQWCRWSPAVPQGAPLSPLLANLVLHRLLDQHLQRRCGQAWLRYADDLVVVCDHRLQALGVLAWLQHLLAPAGLQLNPAKTRISTSWSPMTVLGSTQSGGAPSWHSQAQDWTCAAAPWWERAATPGSRAPLPPKTS